MKLSESTLTILKNFSTINQGIAIKTGSTLKTVSKQMNILAKATVVEKFEKDFVIYDLNRFLGLLSSLDDPEISIKEKNLVITSGSSKSTYGLSDESMVVAAPEKEIKVKDAEVNFRLTKEVLSKVLKLSGVLGLPNVAVIGNGEKIAITTLDVKNDASDDFSIEVGETTAKFRMIFNTENLKMIPGTYDVSISSGGVSHLKNIADNIEYWIATETGSSYEA